MGSAPFGTDEVDGDGYIDARCCNVDAAGASICGDDCNDADDNVHPTEAERCDGVDTDCDGLVDEGVTIHVYLDDDLDGHGVAGQAPFEACSAEMGLSTLSNDCDDTNPAIRPGVMECLPEGGGLVRICANDGLWTPPVSCPPGLTCVAQPNGSGLCLPLSVNSGPPGDPIPFP